MTTDLGQAPARPDTPVPRPRGAHAATKGGLFRRTSRPQYSPRPDPPPASPAAPANSPQLSSPVPRPRRAAAATPQEPQELQKAREPQKTEKPGEPQEAGETRTLQGAQSAPWSPDPLLAGMAASGASTAAADAWSDQLTAPRPATVRTAAADLCAMALVAVVIPLVVLQIPNAIAWALPARMAAAGPNVVASLLRASGLGLPALAIAAPFGALAVRRLRPSPVLLAGLLVIAAADMLGGASRTVALIGVDRSLHGLGAGIAMAAVVAIMARPPMPRRSLPGWWAAVTVVSLTAAPGLMRYRATSGDWHAALQPSPWLTGAALALAALYAILAEGTATAAARSAFPAAERSQLALLVAPVAGMCAITEAITYRGGTAVIAATIAATIALSGLAVMTARAGTAARFAVVCAVAGFTLAPAAGAVTALAQPTMTSGCAALAAALCGATLALLPRQAPGGDPSGCGARHRAITAGGLSLAAAGFAAFYLAGPGNVPSRMLTVLCLPLAGGLAAALTSSLRTTGAAGAMAGVVLLLAGVVVGTLAAGAIQLRALLGARTAPAVHGAMVTAAGRWALVAAAVTAAVALAMAVTTIRRPAPQLRSPPGPGGAPRSGPPAGP